MGKFPRCLNLTSACEPRASDEADEPQPSDALNRAVQLTATFGVKHFKEMRAKYVVVGLQPETGQINFASDLPNDVAAQLLQEAAEKMLLGGVSAVPFIPFLSQQVAAEDPESVARRDKVGVRTPPVLLDTERSSDVAVVGDRDLLGRLINLAEGEDDEETER